MINPNYYYHSTGGYMGIYSSLDKISSIFNDGVIKVNKNTTSVDGTSHRGLKRIYLCDPSKPEIPSLLSSLDLYISRSPSLALERSFDVITPVYSSNKDYDINERSNLYDEVRTDYDIPLKHLVSVILPLNILIKEYDEAKKHSLSRESKRAFLDRLRFMKDALDSAKKYDSSLPISDFSTNYQITSDTLEDIIAYISENKNSKLTLLR